MSMSDTAEYWNDIKRPYTGPDYYHIPGAECGHRHLYEAKYIDQVNCKGCLQLLKDGIAHTLKSAEQHKKDDDNKEKSRVGNIKKQWLKKYPNNPVCACGFVMIERVNRFDGNKFWGCSNYPNCKNTKSLQNGK